MRGKFFSVLVAAITLTALAVPSASAVRFATVGNAKSAACAGGTSVRLVSTRRLPAGAMVYTYKLPHGTTFQNIAPPAGFNSATASKALLAELNLPPRPAAAAARKAWNAQAAPFSKSRISGATKFCEDNASRKPTTATTGGPRVVPFLHSACQCESGYELENPPYNKVVGHFVQPFVNASDGGYISSWIGLNGTTQESNDRLLQAGADTQTGAPFWEEECNTGGSDCNGAVQDHSNLVSPGDTVSVAVWSNPTTYVSYYQLAINGTLVINATHPMLVNVAHTGDVADFMTERPGTNLIPGFTTIVFSASRTYAGFNNSTSIPFGSQTALAVEMSQNGQFYSPPCSTSPNILIYPASVTSGGFTNYFCNY
jgi:hypothetical protein